MEKLEFWVGVSTIFGVLVPLVWKVAVSVERRRAARIEREKSDAAEDRRRAVSMRAALIRERAAREVRRRMSTDISPQVRVHLEDELDFAAADQLVREGDAEREGDILVLVVHQLNALDRRMLREINTRAFGS